MWLIGHQYSICKAIYHIVCGWTIGFDLLVSLENSTAVNAYTITGVNIASLSRDTRTTSEDTGPGSVRVAACPPPPSPPAVECVAEGQDRLDHPMMIMFIGVSASTAALQASSVKQN